MNDLENLTKKQRTVFDEDNMISYAWRIRKYFKNCQTAIDIGCGIGYQTAKLSELLPHIHFIMLDKSGDESPTNYSDVGYIHNNLDLTRQYAKNYINGEVYDIDQYHWNDTVQLVFSTLSWGWHYPVELYLDQVLKLNPQYIIFDTRKNKINIKDYTCVDSFRINRKENTVVFKSLL